MQICESEVFVRLFFTFMLANSCTIPFLQVVCQQETELRLWLSLTSNKRCSDLRRFGSSGRNRRFLLFLKRLLKRPHVLYKHGL